MEKSRIKRILFYRETPGIGDVIMMLRAIELTKLKHSNTEIIVQTRYNELLKYHPAIDYYADLNTIIENVDVRVDNSFYCAEYEAKHTPVLLRSRHQLFCENTAKVLVEHGLEPIEYDGRPQSLYVSRELNGWAQTIIKNTVSEGTIPIGIFGKSKEAWKTYPRMRDLIKLLLADRRFTLCYFDDKEQLPIWNVNQFIGYSLDKVAVLVSQMALVISPDSAGLHIAGGLNVPMVGIFGPTNPLLLIVHYFQASWVPVKCLYHPCGYNVCKELRCLNSIKPKQIYNTIKADMLKRNYQVKNSNITNHASKEIKPIVKPSISLPNKQIGNKEKIVIARMKGVGDVLMTWFGLEVLRKQNPDAHITYVTSGNCADLFYGQDDLVDKVHISGWDYPPEGIPRLPAEIRNIPHERLIELDNRIDFHDTIEKTLGDRKLLHTSPRADNFAKLMGVTLDGNIIQRNLKIPPEIDKWANDVLQGFFKVSKISFVSCQLDAKGTTRNWHIDRWLQLSELLVEKGYNVIWFSTTPEHKFLKLDGVLNLACQTSLSQMIALMNRCQYAISTCSASIHIAHRLSNTIPIGIYGSTDYKLLAAYYDDLIPITNYAMPCAPCADWGHECLGQPGAPWCINQISPRRVLNAISEN